MDFLNKKNKKNIIVAYERKIKITSSLQDAYKLYKREYKDIDKRLYLDIAYELMSTVKDYI